MNTEHLLDEKQTTDPFPANGPRPASGNINQSAPQTAQQLKDQAAQAAEQLKNKGGEALQQVRDQARDMASQQRDNLLERLGHCSSASRKAAEQLRQEDDPTMARYADAIADRLERGTRYLREREFSGMVQDAENFVRRQPEVFFSGMFVAGLILTRFMKASSRSQNRIGRGRESQRGAWGRELEEDVDELGAGMKSSHSEASPSGLGAMPGNSMGQANAPIVAGHNMPQQTGSAPGCGC